MEPSRELGVPEQIDLADRYLCRGVQASGAERAQQEHQVLPRPRRYGDLSFATSRDLRKLRQEPEQVDNIEELSAHHSLMAVRKRFDSMSKSREELQRAVEELEQRREKLEGERRRFEEERGQGSGRVRGLEEGLQAVRLQLEESETERKVLLGMAERLRSDRVVYDLRKHKLEKELQYIQRQKQIILRENAGKLEEEDKTRRIHQKLLEHLEAEQQERASHVGSVTAMITEKVNLSENSELRRSEMQGIAESTMQDKDPR